MLLPNKRFGQDKVCREIWLDQKNFIYVVRIGPDSPLQPNISENFTLVSNNFEQFTVPPEYTISSRKLESIKEVCTSSRNFCVQLLRILFSKEELVDSNLSDIKGNRMLDPVRIKAIFYYYDLYYPPNLPP